MTAGPLSRFTVARPDARARRSDRRALPRRLGRQLHQGRDAAVAPATWTWAGRAMGPTSRTCIATSGRSRSTSRSRTACAVFMKLVEKADVVVENYRADVKFRLGIDYESLKKVNPRIILGSISGFGQDGPYAERARLRPDRPGHGRPDVGHRHAEAGPGARRYRRGRRGRGPALRHRHPDRAAGTRDLGPGPVDLDLAAAGR